MSFSRFGDWLANTTIASFNGRQVLHPDIALRRLLVLSKLFTTGWGHPNTLKDLAKHRREVMSKRLISPAVENMNIEMVIEKEDVTNGVRTIEGRFLSPHAVLYPDQMKGPLKWAKWRGIFPVKERKGLCIHLAGTGDHSYFRREQFLANGLLHQHGIASVMLQNPFYTERKPKEQFRSSLRYVSDLFVMGAALMSECNYVLKWAKKEGYFPMCISGVSMGGFMASLAGSNIDFPVGIVPILSWTSASPPYTEGAIAPSIPYRELLSQIQDPAYIDKIKAIPDTDWIDKMHLLNAQNEKGLAHNFMCILMDEFTLLSNYPTPIDCSSCTAIIAEDDRYVVRGHGSPHFEEIWPGMKVETMQKVGHVEAYLLGHELFRRTIYETLLRLTHVN